MKSIDPLLVKQRIAAWRAYYAVMRALRELEKASREIDKIAQDYP